MKIRILSLMLLTSVLLAACGSASSPTQAPVSTATPFVSPITSPIATPVAPRPGGGLVTRPQAELWANAPAAALAARKMLVDQLKVDIDAIGLVSVEKVDWPDACLGVYTPGIMCAQVITRGYKVILAANGRQYEFHTNDSGDGVKLATP